MTNRDARITAATLGRPQRDTKSELELELDRLPSGGALHRTIDGHLFTFIATNSSRRRYCVVCSTCEKLAHEATSLPIENARRHVQEAGGQ